MFSCKTKMTSQVTSELLHPILVWAIVLTSVGGAGLFLMFAIYLFTGFENFYIDLWLWICLVLGVTYFVLIAIGKKNNKKIMEDETVYEFYDDYFTLTSIKNGEQMSTGKAYYKDMVKVKESKSYIFIYPNKAMAYPVGKTDLAAEDLAKLRTILKLPSKTKQGIVGFKVLFLGFKKFWLNWGRALLRINFDFPL